MSDLDPLFCTWLDVHKLFFFFPNKVRFSPSASLTELIFSLGPPPLVLWRQEALWMCAASMWAPAWLVWGRGGGLHERRKAGDVGVRWASLCDVTGDDRLEDAGSTPAPQHPHGWAKEHVGSVCLGFFNLAVLNHGNHSQESWWLAFEMPRSYISIIWSWVLVVNVGGTGVGRSVLTDN